MNNAAFTLALSIFMPYVFFWANNRHMFALDEILFSAAAVFLFAAAVFVSGTLCTRLVVVLAPIGCRAGKARLVNMAYIAMSFAWLAFLFKSLWPPDGNYPLCFFVVILLGTATITLFRLHSAFTVFLLVFLCFSIARLSYSLIFDSNSAAKLAQHSQHRDIDDIKFADKPDIYLFILESYHGIEVLNSVYNFDTIHLESYLDTYNFVYYQNIYSNSMFTLQSICDMYAMQSYKSVGRGYLDVVQAVRNLIGGNEHNTVFRILKNNGYYIENMYLENQSYYLLTQGEYLDRVDRQFFTELDRLSQPIYSINNNIFEKSSLLFRRPEPSSLTEALNNALARRPGDKPYFLAVKTGADHSPATGYTWRQAGEWVASGRYQRLMSESLSELLPALSRIIDTNPEALIILIGDHGPARYRDFLPKTFGTDEAIDARCAENDITRQDIADDLFNVFLAVKMPGARKDISGGYSMSQCNVFQHVFSELCRDALFLKKRAVSVSGDGKWTVAREGKVLQKWRADEERAHP